MSSSHSSGPTDPDAEPDTEVTRVEPTGPAPRPDARGSEPEPEPAPSLGRGAQIGRYLVIDTLGRGGMGEVLSAYDPELDRRIALKLVRFGANEDASRARVRLLREAQAMAKLAHPNVVAVYDAGTHGDRVFIAMEYIEGRTLRQWLALDEGRDTSEAPTRDWRESLAMLMQAGRGLAAAHAEDLVHRDFKPANVMVSDDGRVRVLDFGLARRFGERDDEDPDDLLAVDRSRSGAFEPLDGPSGSRSSLRLQLTQTGMVMGTPAYMAPEQFFGGHIDARTDQFSFCVVLYRALTGQRPFAGDDFRSLGRAVARGELREFPKAARIPRGIQAALRRGLSVSRDGRFPTMDALLAALERAAGEERRRRIQLGGGAALLLGAGGVVMLASREPAAGPPPPPPPCQGAEEIVASAWSPERRAAMETAFSASKLAYAEDARVQAERGLDAYAARWVALHTQTCEATRVRGDQSEALMDLRIGCLQGRLGDLEALTGLLGQADAAVVEHAAQAVLRLPRLDDCVTLERDAQGLFVPDDPAQVERVAAIRTQLAEGRARVLAGKYDDALAVAEPALAQARESGYRPAIAEAATVVGQCHMLDHKHERAKEAYEEALYAAAASGHGYYEAQSLVGLLSVLGLSTADIEGAQRYARHAQALAERLGHPAELEAGAAMYLGTAFVRAQRLEQAVVQLRHAVEVSRDSESTELLHIGALNNLAAAEGSQGHYKEAIAAFEAALAIAEARLGPRHPNIATHHNNIGVSYSRLGEPAKALPHQRRAVEIWEQSLGPDHAETGRGYHNLGVAQAELGQYDAAYASYRRALEIKSKALGPDDASVAFSHNNVGDALLRLGRPAEAIPHFEEALRAWKVTLGEDNPSNVYAWVSLAQAYLALDDPAAGLTPARRALTLCEGTELDPLVRAQAYFVAGQVVLAAEDDRAEAVRLAEQAEQAYAALDRPSQEELEEVRAWLADHR